MARAIQHCREFPNRNVYLESSQMKMCPHIKRIRHIRTSISNTSKPTLLLAYSVKIKIFYMLI